MVSLSLAFGFCESTGLRFYAVSCVFAAALFLLSNCPVQAQAVEPIVPLVWGPLQFSGLLDFYGTWNSNHPASDTNQLVSFDTRAFRPTLNMVEIGVSADPSPVGFEVDAGAGHIYKLLSTNEPHNSLQNFTQMYIDYRSKTLADIEFDFGKFGTSAGVESVETISGWNYSRSLLFTWAQPNYHFGLRTTAPVGKHLKLGFQVVNGWNRTLNGNGFRTVGLTAVFSCGKLTWFQDYYTGPEQVSKGGQYGGRHLYDSTWIYAPRRLLKFDLNVDFGWQNIPQLPTARWGGVAMSGQLSTGKHFAFSPRWEYFADPQGYTTGVAQHIKEFTLTGDWQIRRWFLIRAEYRLDWSDKAVFERGTNGHESHQNVALISMLAYLGSLGK
jgi:Putative beta-barrel porin-2, OmpL-like. bbp2